MLDGRTLDVPDGVADLTFSYITLQHCSRSDALALVDEALRVLRPGGTVALNFRQRVWADVALLPLGKVVRALFSVPGLGPWLSQAPGGDPDGLAGQPARPAPRPRPDPRPGGRRRDLAQPSAAGPDLGRPRAELRYFESINPAHWWLWLVASPLEPTVTNAVRRPPRAETPARATRCGPA